MIYTIGDRSRFKSLIHSASFEHISNSLLLQTYEGEALALLPELRWLRASLLVPYVSVPVQKALQNALVQV